MLYEAKTWTMNLNQEKLLSTVMVVGGSKMSRMERVGNNTIEHLTEVENAVVEVIE